MLAATDQIQLNHAETDASLVTSVDTSDSSLSDSMYTRHQSRVTGRGYQRKSTYNKRYKVILYIISVNTISQWNNVS